MLRDGWRIKANTDVNADAKNVYGFLEQHTGFPAIPMYLLSTSLGYSQVHLLPGDTSVTFLSARQPSSNFRPFLRILSPPFTLAEHEKVAFVKVM